MRINVYTRTELDPREYLKRESSGSIKTEKRGYSKISEIEVDTIDDNELVLEASRGNFQNSLVKYIRYYTLKELENSKSSKVALFFTKEIVNNREVFHSFEGASGLIIVQTKAISDNEISVEDFYKLMDISSSKVASFDLQAKNRILWKRVREINVNKIVVDVNGKKFDGDEVSQERMARAILVSQLSNQTQTTWKMADNKNITVTVQDLKDALVKASQAQSSYWV